MIRRARLRPGSWNRKPPKPQTFKRDLWEIRRLKQQAARAKDKALTWGADYQQFLRGWFKLNGCCACTKWAPACHLHHVRHRSQKGRAASLVPLCPACHTEDGRGIEAKAAQDYGADLFVLAAGFALAGTQLGFLPPEQCACCGTWRSTRYLIDETDQRTGVTRRVCVECAPEGPI